MANNRLQSIEGWIGLKWLAGNRWSRERLLFLVVGVMLTQSIVLRRIASRQAAWQGNSTNAASHERRLRRTLNDPNLSWDKSYKPTLKVVMRWQRGGCLRILIDESGQAEHFRVLMASVWYRGRTVPLAWLQWLGQTPQSESYWDKCERLLKLVAEVLPAGSKVVVIADRAFGHPTFTDLVVKHSWEWVVRVQRQTCFHDVQGCTTTLQALLPTPGQRWKGRGQLFKKAGWRTASVVGLWSAQHKEPLWVVSSLPLGWYLLEEYKRRSAIETLFRDWKSYGFHWESSQVTELDHHACLLLALALATLFTLCLGEQQATEWLATQVQGRSTPAWEAKNSLFRLGLDRFQALLAGTCLQTPVWQLSHFDAPAWSRHSRRHHALHGTILHAA